MTTLILLRHGRSSANTAGVLAGRSEGVALDDHGRSQADAVAARLEPVPLAAVVTSPLQRCRETLAPLLAARGIEPIVDDRIAEVDYGSWTGRELKTLTDEPLWRVVQSHPSAAVFPDGEGLAAMQARAVTAIREHDRRIAAEHGPGAVWVACSHGDVIKGVLADALGLHLDGFQRIVVDPASMSIVSYTETRPFVVRTNDGGTDLRSLIPPPPTEGEAPAVPSSDAAVGGGSGAAHHGAVD